MSEGFNAADRKDVRAAEKAARQAEREREDTVRSLCSNNGGRQYIWDKLSAAGIFVAVPPSDALAMAFAEGVRAQGLALLNDVITSCPEQFIRMMQESNERNLTRRSPSGERPGSKDSGRESKGPSDVAFDGQDISYIGDEGRAED